MSGMCVADYPALATVCLLHSLRTQNGLPAKQIFLSVIPNAERDLGLLVVARYRGGH
jgi:hypothetical protein